jgi:biotin transport system ATP-binding protein
MRPQIIICDEPFSNLDAPSVVEVLESLILLRNAGCGVVVVTHEVEKVLAHAERLIVMEHGRIAYDGTPAGGLAGFARWGLRPPIPQRGTSAVPVRNREELSTVTWIEAPANLPEEPE